MIPSVPEFPLTIADLRVSAAALRREAFRPGTRRNQANHIKLYLSFCEHYNLKPVQPDTDTICNFATYLSQRLRSPKSVTNYLSSVNLMHKYLRTPAPALDSFELQLTTRAIKLSMRHVKDQKLPITPALLYKLCTICDGLDCPLGRMLKCAFTIAFFGFLRQSNLAPRTPAAFDPTRHTCRGNVSVTPHGLHVILNWSKTNQHMNTHTIPLPALQDATVDPRAAYVAMLSDTPTTSRHEPLLQLPAKSGRTTVTVGTIAACLNQLLIQAGADHRRYSLHSFRRGGATAASLGGGAATDIQSHGGWRSSAFLEYICKQPDDTTVTPALAVAAAPRRTASPAAARAGTSDIRID